MTKDTGQPSDIGQLLQALRERDEIIARQAEQIDNLTSKIDKLISEINEIKSDTFHSRKQNKKKSNKMFPPLEKTIITQNRFEPLEEEEHMEATETTEPWGELPQAEHTVSEASVTTIKETNKITDDQPPSKIPPIILREKEQSDIAVEHFDLKNIKWLHVKNISSGIKVFFADIQSYREATKYLDKTNKPYYTFTPPDEKTLRVVLRGVREHYTEETITEDLKTQGLHPEKVARLKNSDKKPIPLVLVILPREEKEVYKLKYVKHLPIMVEAQKPKATIG